MPIKYLLFHLFTIFLWVSLAGQSAPDAEQQRMLDLLREGDRYIEQEQYHAAQSVFERACRYFESRSDCYHTAYCYLWLGEAAYGLGDFRQAMNLGLRAEQVADKCPQRDTMPFYSMILQNIGVFYSRFGDFDRQMGYYEKAFQWILAREGRVSERGADAYFNLGAAFGRRGQWEKAIAYFDTSLQIASGLGYRDGVASAYLNLSYAYGIKQDYVRAIDYQQQALKLTSRKEEMAQGYNNLGVWYGDLGDYVQALDFLEKALRLRKEISPRHSDIFSTFLNIASVCREAGRHEQATEYIDQAIANLRQSEEYDRSFLKVAYHYKAEMLQELGRLKEAEQYARRALEIDSRQPDLESSSRLILASVLLDEERYDEALSHVQEGLARETPGFQPLSVYDDPPLHLIENTSNVLSLLALKARLFYERGAERHSENDLSQSLNIYLLADSLIDFSRRTYPDNTSKERLAANVHDLYAGAIEAGYEIYHLSGDEAYLDLVFSYSEKNKSLLVLEKIHDLYAKAFYGIPSELVEQERQVLQDIDFYSGQIQQYREQTLTPEESDRLEQWKDILFERRQRQQALLDRMKRDYPAYFALKHDLTPATTYEVERDLLAPQEVLLEYFLAGRQLYIFVVGHGQRNLVQVQLPADLIDLVQTFRRSLIRQEDAFYGQSFLLYTLLLQPVEQYIAGKELIIVPDGPLGYVPFEVLLAEPASPEQYGRHWELPYVLRRHALRYTFSANLALAGAAIRWPGKGKVLGIAPNFGNAPAGRVDSGLDLQALRSELSALPGSADEMSLLFDRFQGDFWTGDDARESRLKAEGMNYKLWHFATHTLIDERFPSLSKLVLAPEDGQPDDGFLNAYELYNMRVRAELIVLSACNTGIGKIKEGEGIASLARAFAYAGCPNLVMSLWPVKDGTTPKLMSYFYDNLAAGMDKGRALQAAKLTYLERENDLFLHPFYWGTFIYVGDQRPIELQKKKQGLPNGALPWSLVLLAGLSAGVIWWRRRR